VLVPVDGAGLDSSRSAGQYGTTVRGREAEGGWGEFPLPTYPAYRFAAAGSTAVLVQKLSEYELVSTTDAPDALAVTLSRSVGMMSVNVHPLRDEPAGSEIPVPGAQYLGVAVHTDLAILVGADDATAVRAADLFRHDPLVVRGSGETDGPLPEAAFPVRLTGDVVLESARRVGTEAELRFVNYLSEERDLEFASPGGWSRVDLAGEVQDDAFDAASARAVGGGMLSIRRTID
jgi:alpha-mannosidase